MINFGVRFLFENKPERCPFGHQLWPGKCQVSWTQWANPEARPDVRGGPP